MLCAVCMSIFLSDKRSGHHHKDWQSLVTAGETGCKICLSVLHTQRRSRPASKTEPFQYKVNWERSWRDHWAISITAVSYPADIWQPVAAYVHASPAPSAPPGYDGFIDSVKADLEYEPCRVRSEIPALRAIPRSTGDEAVAEVARDWLTKCKNDHTCDMVYEFRKTSWYPKRLVQVGDCNHPPRLIIPEEMDGMVGNYATLSHCWGESPDFLTLTSANLDTFMQEIPLEKLATSFQDAILTCQRLKIPYLWVDCLCILQDGEGSHADWLLHSRIMHEVYVNCELNIAISASKNPHEGAFRTRNTDFLQDCYVWTQFFAPPSNTFTHTPDSVDEHPPPADDQSTSTLDTDFNLLAVFSPADFTYQMIDSPLSQRAWVLQEKLLSPRTLSFRDDRISWECEKVVSLTEYMPDSIANKEGLGGRTGFDCLFQSQYNIHGGSERYQEYATQYTDRALSHPQEDKFVAFAAIARRCASSLEKNDRYCAGLFESTMPQSLLWHTYPYPGPMPRLTSPEYRAPSWSWASLDHPVRFPFLPRDITSKAEIVNVHIELADPSDPFGQLKSASLTITGPLISSQALRLITPVREGERRLPPCEVRVMTNRGSSIKIVTDDFGPQEPDHEKWLAYLRETGGTGNVHFLAVTESEMYAEWYPGCGTLGLALQMMENGQYARVGRWEAELGFIQKHSDEDRLFQNETITII